MAAAHFIPLSTMRVPQVLIAEKDYLIVYKPPRMHSAPQPRSAETDTLFGWCAMEFPEVAALPGRRAGEGGLLHRLDYETQGLLLVARTQAGMESLLEQQRKGAMLKEYSALTASGAALVEGPRQMPGFPAEKPGIREPLPGLRIQSAFRPYGPGRKAVRPAIAGEQYLTEVLEAHSFAGGLAALRLRIFRGFRHQIRCHLAWLHMPILNDSLYGGAPFGSGLLGLRACSLLFADPASGVERVFSIPPLEPGTFFA